MIRSIASTVSPSLVWPAWHSPVIPASLLDQSVSTILLKSHNQPSAAILQPAHCHNTASQPTAMTGQIKDLSKSCRFRLL